MATEIVCAIRSAGGDYSNGTLWEADLGTVDLTSAATKVFSHSGITGSLASGDAVTGANSGATGTIVLVTATQILIQSITGTFQSAEQIYETISVNYVTSSDAGDSAIAVAEYYDDWPSGLADALYVNGQTASATNKIILRVAAGHEHDGTIAHTGFYAKLAANYEECFYLQADHVYCYDLDADNPGTTGSGAFAFRVNSSNNLFYRCIGRGGDKAFGSLKTGYLYSCLAHNSNEGFQILNWEFANFHNCVAADCTDGWDKTGTNGTGSLFINCASINNTNEYTANVLASVHASSTHNAGETATAADIPGSNSIVSLTTAAFNNAAGGDYHLAGTGSALYHAGSNTTAANDDIDGDTLDASTPSVGIDEIVAAGGATGKSNPLYGPFGGPLMGALG